MGSTLKKHTRSALAPVHNWLWVAITTKTAVFHIGSRRKEELSYLVQEAFLGWLITDGYAVYRSHSKRQRCLAHLILFAYAITGAINQKAAQIGQWILDDNSGINC